MINKKFMDIAYDEALKAFDKNEIPIGCVIVKDGQVIGRGHNTREGEQNLFGHAEINAIKQASEYLNTWKFDNCEMYVTVEPCLMCYGSILQARIPKVYIGARQHSNKPSSYANYITDDQIIDDQLIDDKIKELMQVFFKQLRR